MSDMSAAPDLYAAGNAAREAAITAVNSPDPKLPAKMYAEAMHDYEEAANLGYAPAQTMMGDMAINKVVNLYLNRQPDYAAAMKWFNLAADKGYAPALYNRGLLKESGGGPVTANPTEAFNDFLAAAQKGFFYAEQHVARIYAAQNNPTERDRWLKAPGKNDYEFIHTEESEWRKKYPAAPGGPKKADTSTPDTTSKHASADQTHMTIRDLKNYDSKHAAGPAPATQEPNSANPGVRVTVVTQPTKTPGLSSTDFA